MESELGSLDTTVRVCKITNTHSTGFVHTGPQQIMMHCRTYLWRPASWRVVATAVRTEGCRGPLEGKATEWCCCVQQLPTSSRSGADADADACAGAGSPAVAVAPPVQAPPILWLPRSRSFSQSALPINIHVSRDTMCATDGLLCNHECSGHDLETQLALTAALERNSTGMAFGVWKDPTAGAAPPLRLCRFPRPWSDWLKSRA